MRLNNSKKGVLGYFFMFVVVVALITFLIASISYDKGAEDVVIGKNQMELIGLSKEAEKAMLYIDNSAKISAEQAFHELASHGGFHDTAVPEEFFGYAVWDYNIGQLPKNTIEDLGKYINGNLDRYLERYEAAGLPADNYDYYFTPGKIIGIARSNIVLSKKDEKNAEDILKYSVKPSFTVNTGYDLDEYKQIREEGFRLYESLDECASIDRWCVRKKLVELGLDWQQECGFTDAAYYALLEQLYYCSEAESYHCMCEIDIGKKAGHPEKNYDIAISQTNENGKTLTYFAYDKNTYPIEAKLLISEGYPKDRFSPLIKDLISGDRKINLKLKYDKIELSHADLDGIKLSEKIKIYKAKGGLAVISDNEFNDENNRYDEIDECMLPKEKIFRFCVNSDYKSFFLDGEELEYKGVTYKFALKKQVQ